MRGRKPRPSHLRVVDGTKPRNGTNAREPQVKRNLHAVPEGLTKGQKEAWTYAIANAPAGLLKTLDRDVLLTYVVARDLLMEANKKQAKLSMVRRTAFGTDVVSPYINVIAKQSLILMKAAAEMGFTPSSRSRIEIDAEAENDDPAEKYFDDK
jgi:P27 family predicted phage terminase small subunit